MTDIMLGCYTRKDWVKKARLEHSSGIRLKKEGFLMLAQQCFSFARLYMKGARTCEK